MEVAKVEIETHFARHIPTGGVVVDAGASLGDHTATYARLVGPEGHVLAFEPTPEAFECLKRNFENQSWVHPLPFALAGADDTRFIARNPNVGASYLIKPDDDTVIRPKDDTLRVCKICTVKLDTYGKQLRRLDFIHLDCEGTEPDVLMGGRETIETFKPVMVLEIQKQALARQGNTEDDVLNLLMAFGYRWQEFPGCSPEQVQRDIICFPK